MADSISMTTAWTGGFKGTGAIEGEGFSLPTGIPTSLGGSGNGAAPKELFTAATAACFTATLRAISEGKKVPVDTLSVDTAAEAGDDSFTITHTAHVELAHGSSEADIETAKRAIESADNICAVGNLAKKAGVVIDVVADVTTAAAVEA